MKKTNRAIQDGVITHVEMLSEKEKIENLLENIKMNEKGKKYVSVDNNTIICIPADADPVERIEIFKKKLEQSRKRYNIQ